MWLGGRASGIIALQGAAIITITLSVRQEIAYESHHEANVLGRRLVMDRLLFYWPHSLRKYCPGAGSACATRPTLSARLCKHANPTGNV
jgi:hypothetical protein